MRPANDCKTSPVVFTAGRKPCLRRLVFMFPFIFAAGSASAFELSTDSALSFVRSDNVSPGSPQETPATLGTLRVGAEMRSLTPRLSLDFDSSLTYYEYLDGGYDSETLPQVSGLANWQIMPDRLSWFVREELGQVGGQNFGELRPVVREDVNYLTTGPTLTLPLGGRNELEVSGTFSDVNSSGTGFDSTRYMGSAQVRRRLTDRRTLGLRYSFTKIEYDDVVGFDGYERSIASVHFESVARRGTTVAEIGVSKVSQAAGGDENSPLFLLTITRRLGGHSTLAFTVSSASSDASDAFRDGIGGAIAPGGDAVLPLSAEPFVVDSSSLEWTHGASRFSTQVTALYEKERYSGQAIADRERTGATIASSYRWSSRSESAASIQFERNISADPAFNDRNWALSFSYSRRLANAIFGTASYMRFDRERDGVGLSQIENRWMLTVNYRPSPFTIGRPVGSVRGTSPAGMRRRSIGDDLSRPEGQDVP